MVTKSSISKFGVILTGAGLFSHCLSPDVSAMPAPIAGVQHLALSPDGEVVAASGYGLDGGIKIWNVQRRFSYPGVGETEWIYLGFSPDGTELRASQGDSLRSWKLTTGKEVFNQSLNLTGRDLIVVSQDARHVAQVISDRKTPPTFKIEIRNIGETPSSISIPESGEPLAFSPDGGLLICLQVSPERDESDANKNTTDHLRIFNTKSGDLLQSLPIKKSDSLKVSFLNDGKQLAVALKGGKVTVFDVSDGKVTKNFDIPMDKSSWSNPFYFSEDGETLATSDENIQIWNVRQGTLQTTLSSSYRLLVNDIVFSADKKTVAAGTSVSNYKYNSTEPMIYVWNAESGQLVATFR